MWTIVAHENVPVYLINCPLTPMMIFGPTKNHHWSPSLSTKHPAISRGLHLLKIVSSQQDTRASFSSTLVTWFYFVHTWPCLECASHCSPCPGALLWKCDVVNPLQHRAACLLAVNSTYPVSCWNLWKFAAYSQRSQSVQRMKRWCPTAPPPSLCPSAPQPKSASPSWPWPSRWME